MNHKPATARENVTNHPHGPGAMSAQAHTPGPLLEPVPYGATHFEIQGDEPRRHIARLPMLADARRIVACWNACEGIPIDALEGNTAFPTLAELIAERDRLREINAELIAALEAEAA